MFTHLKGYMHQLKSEQARHFFYSKHLYIYIYYFAIWFIWSTFCFYQQ